MYNYKFLLGLILIFIITASFDIALNILPPPLGAVILRQYFNEHTLLSAALIAGFIGAITFCVLYLIYGDIPEMSVYNILIIFIISALMGVPIRLSKLFPSLDKHYYQVIPRIQSFLADGLSGIMVAVVYYFIINYN